MITSSSPLLAVAQTYLALAATVTAAILTVALVVALVLLVRRMESGPRRDADRADRTRATLGATVLVPVARPRSAAHLVDVGAVFAAAAKGRVCVLTVRGDQPAEQERTAAEMLLQQAEVAAVDAGVDIETSLRVGRDVSEAVLHATVERDATLIVVGWPSADRDGVRLGPPVDRIVSDAPAPVIVARIDGHPWQRVLLRLPDASEVSEAHLRSVRLAVETARLLSRAHDVPLLRSSDPRDQRIVELTADVQLDVDGGSEEAPYGSPDVLTVAGVEPAPGALEDALARTETTGDVLLALAHGPTAEDRRPLLPTAEELDDDDRDEGDATANAGA